MRISVVGQRLIVAFAVILLGASIWAVKFSRHPGIWLIVLTASIPLFAAAVGSFLAESGRGRD